MKTQFLTLQLSLLLGAAASAAPLGTAFTYQGRLNNGALPATGLYDFNFKLYDAESVGALVGPAAGVSLNAVGVTNGVFSVTLDFGTVFNGDKRWLDLSVNTTAVRPLAPLTPRQPVYAAPYALFALKAAQADAATTAGVANSVAANAVNNVGLANNSVTGGKIVNGSVVRSVNGLSDALTLAAGPNITLGTVGNTLTISGSGSGSPAWLLSGNGGTGSTNFLGTTDNTPLDVRVNNQRGLRLEPTSEGPNLIGGSRSNVVMSGALGATIGGGGHFVLGFDQRNRVSDSYGIVSGGALNLAGNTNASPNDAKYATTGGGYSNQAQGEQSTVSGGRGNRALGTNATIGGGQVNQVASRNGTIAGGFANTNQAESGIVGGGEYNFVGTNVFLGLEVSFTNRGDYSGILGGFFNRVGSLFSSISGGSGNRVFGDYGFIGGGIQNLIGHPGSPSDSVIISTIGGGSNNRAENGGATIAGGERNVVGGLWSSIGGGVFNEAWGYHAAVLGGRNNRAWAENSTVLGGMDNEAGTNNGGIFTGTFTLAAGRRAKARHQGSFVWGDSTDADIASTNANSITFRATGGVRIFSAAPDSSGFPPPVGVRLAPNSGSWASLSDRNAKTDFGDVNKREVLEKVALLPVSVWRYRGEEASIRHIGPTAQDFKTAFGTGDSDTSITTVDADGVALAAIQGLHELMKEKDAELRELKQAVRELQRRLNAAVPATR